MLKKTFHSFLTSALDRAERQTLNPPKELLIPVGKEAYVLVGSPEQLAVNRLRTTRYVCLGDIWNESIL